MSLQKSSQESKHDAEIGKGSIAAPSPFQLERLFYFGSESGAVCVATTRASVGPTALRRGPEDGLSPRPPSAQARPPTQPDQGIHRQFAIADGRFSRLRIPANRQSHARRRMLPGSFARVSISGSTVTFPRWGEPAEPPSRTKAVTAIERWSAASTLGYDGSGRSTAA